MGLPRVWLITGASSGFGRALTEVVLQKGEIVVAAVRSPSDLTVLRDAHGTEQLLILKCDVSNYDDIKNVFDHTVEQFGRCDVVFNCAGYGVLAEVEGTPDETARKMFEVNFWGATIVSREAVRVFREVNKGRSGGRLLNVSSGGGLVGLPACGYYSASKHALEGFTEAFAKELDPEWNIKISIVAPGAFRTRAHTHSVVKVPVHQAYQSSKLLSSHVRSWFEALDGPMGDPKRAAEKIFEFSNLDIPPMRWALGKDSVSGARNKAETVLKDTEDFQDWSEGLYLN